jgi:hypothetical protein
LIEYELKPSLVGAQVVATTPQSSQAASAYAERRKKMRGTRLHLPLRLLIVARTFLPHWNFTTLALCEVASLERTN